MRTGRYYSIRASSIIRQRFSNGSIISHSTVRESKVYVSLKAQLACGQQAPGAVSSFHTLQGRSVIIYSHWPLTWPISVPSTPLSLPGTGESQGGVGYCCLVMKCWRRESALWSHDVERRATSALNMKKHTHNGWGGGIHPACIWHELSHTVHRLYPRAFFHGGPSACVQT